MEVHHHAHHASGGTRKKWTHYFWEFLMLFLAVFCGFLAENLREHKVEHIRAKEFARSLVKDLANDTAAIISYKKSAARYISICDTLLELNKTKLEGPAASRFSFYTRFTYWTAGVTWNRTTFEQIKNSGSLRYFKHGLLEKLMKYDAVINDIGGEFFNHETRGNMLLNSINKIIEPGLHHDVSKLYLWSFDTISKETQQNYEAIKTQSLESKRDEITELLNMIVVQQRNLRFGERRIQTAEELSRELIREFTDEYHL